MINFNNHNITGMSYNNHVIKRAYGCDARLVWEAKSEYEDEYFTLVANAPSSVIFSNNGLEYSLNGGDWTSLSSADTLSLNTDDVARFRGTIQPKDDGLDGGIGSFSASTGDFSAQGNVMSLLFGDNFIGQKDLTGKNCAFVNLFGNPSYKEFTYALTSIDNLVLPATTLSPECYESMFIACAGLKRVPSDLLPANALTPKCYKYMFKRCINIKNTPSLNSTSLADFCYQAMFEYCLRLVDVPEILPATTLALACYGSMFSQCVNISRAPQLPATTLTEGCYNGMFDRCSKLVEAPVLSAETLVRTCYEYMFHKCELLNEITCLATGTTETSIGNNCTFGWVSGVSPTGTFYKHKNMTSWTIGNNGIPTGWVVKDYNPPFQGKWLATYRDGHTNSAECGSSSTITSGEITKESLVSVEIGECVTIIGNWAFQGCSSLTSVTIPNSVTNIGQNAFSDCSSLTSVIIPNSVKIIVFSAFQGCSSLTSVTIPNSVTKIGQYVFNGCTSLASITVEALIPPTLGSGAFNYTNDCPIYVPAESLETYKSASVWSIYSSRIQPIQ